MREIKFQYMFKSYKNTIVKNTITLEDLQSGDLNFDGIHLKQMENNKLIIAKRQYTGLKDKNGMGLTEVYECDIIDENGIIKGNIYEMDKRETDIIIPQLGTKAWNTAYEEAVVRGFDYSE